ncbi:YidC/Oxa1 family membrane protein insertase [Umezawaea beigongshangensis]|uniref:YidC/Oxa1 family membrane protein insertase n=1 Tax=Umezawaea beigongshangensis TaxID=2780383 RepID=UPI0018F18FC7|nr:membrane protein insertase YidC [Umezawaea beigongshangensis]
MLAFLDVPVSAVHDLVSGLAGLTTTAAAIVLCTALVRLLMHPLTRAAVRGERARAALAPQMARLRARHGKDPARLREETLALHRDNRTSLFAGFLPLLVQAPFFTLMYRLFSTPEIAGEPNALLHDTLWGTPLGAHWFGGFAPVFPVLFAGLAVVAWLTVRSQTARTRENGGDVDLPLARVLRLLPFGTVLVAAVLPLAAGIYLLTSTTWTWAERALLHRAAARSPRAGTPVRGRRSGAGRTGRS